MNEGPLEEYVQQRADKVLPKFMAMVEEPEIQGAIARVMARTSVEMALLDLRENKDDEIETKILIAGVCVRAMSALAELFHKKVCPQEGEDYGTRH